MSHIDDTIQWNQLALDGMVRMCEANVAHRVAASQVAKEAQETRLLQIRNEMEELKLEQLKRAYKIEKMAYARACRSVIVAENMEKRLKKIHVRVSMLNLGENLSEQRVFECFRALKQAYLIAVTLGTVKNVEITVDGEKYDCLSYFLGQKTAPNRGSEQFLALAELVGNINQVFNEYLERKNGS